MKGLAQARDFLFEAAGVDDAQAFGPRRLSLVLVRNHSS